MTTSSTDAFEDAEIAREELLRILTAPRMHTNGSGDKQRAIADAILAAGFSLQSPASTTAADAWDEAAEVITDWSLNMVSYPSGLPIDPPVNPYRVAAPEGDGGNEQQ